MSLNTLNLPIDIPWQRIAVSSDMYAPSSDAPLPAKWRSSLAIFSYDPEPDPDPQLTNPQEKTTFLKVVATVTGYQPEGLELDRKVQNTHGFGSATVKAFDKLTDNYYPAFGAIIQVAVFPDEGNWPLSQFPYLTDFEPKKREVIELVSETGESTTQSGTGLNVRKGTTSTNSMEMSNVDKGGSAAFSYGQETGGNKQSISAQVSSQKDVGTRTANGSEATNVISTDASREKRESYSHTTNLSQLYQLLDSYHSGTNRAIFFLNARPHIIDSPYTFVKGPRRLEGIQEFFLVVRRPKDMEKICVTGVLETAHLYENDIPVTIGVTRYDQGEITQTFTDSADTNLTDTSSQGSDKVWKINIPATYQLDVSRGGGTVTYGSDNYNLPGGVVIVHDDVRGTDYNVPPGITPYDDHVDIFSHIEAGNFGRSASRTLTVTVYYRSVQPVETPHQEIEKHVDLFFTARKVSSCSGYLRSGLFVTYEKPMGSEFKQALTLSHKPGRDAALAANEVSRRVRDQVISSFRGSRRYEYGQVDFIQSAFATRELLMSRHPTVVSKEGLVHELTEVPEDIRKHLKTKSASLSVSDVLKQSPENVAEQTGLPVRDARQLIVSLAGVRQVSAYQNPLRISDKEISLQSHSSRADKPVR